MTFPRKQSGGAVTAILANALDEGLIDAVVTVTEDRWSLKPSSVVITRSDVLIQQAGSRYSWWVPLLAALKNAVVERKFHRIAVVGVPCAVQALARIRASDNDLLKPYAKSIRLVIGLFCTETFDYTAARPGKTPKPLQDSNPTRSANWMSKENSKSSNTMAARPPFPSLNWKPASGKAATVALISRQCSQIFLQGLSGARPGQQRWLSGHRTGKGFVDSAVRNGKLTLETGINLAAIEKLATTKIRKNSKK